MNIAERHDHEFPPLIFPDSEILILGSFPSVASRAQKFFYGYPMNRFWGMLAAVYQEDKPNSIEEKTAFCKKHRLALYDFIGSFKLQNPNAEMGIRHANFDELMAWLQSGEIDATVMPEWQLDGLRRVAL